MSDEEKVPAKRGRGRPKGSRSLKTNKAGKFTSQRKKKFLEYMRKNGGNQAASAAKVGVNPATIHYHMKIDPVFKEKVEMAKLEATHLVEEAITKRGVEGYEKDVWYQGNVVGQEKVYSDNLLMERARALMPEKYGKRSQVDINANVTIENKARSKLANLLGIEIAEGEYETIPEEESGE